MPQTDDVETIDPYPPLGTLKAFAEDIWVVDGPVVQMKYIVGSLPFSTRATVIRLPDGRLWVHSPCALTDGLRTELDTLGPVTWLVAPNKLHWLYLANWQRAYPDASTHVAPGVETKAEAGGFRIDAILGDAAPTQWAGTIDQVLVPGSFMTEADFFHQPSRTLIVTDLIENFEPERLHRRWLALLMRLGGVMAPTGSTPRDLRLTFLPHRAAVRDAAATMLNWQPERIVLSHGRCYTRDGTATLQRALAWTNVKTA
ncbi:DUF4336 domain-containing protein [Rhodovibrio salinarum]|uniref:DUF4336 domain-containing protein n=1 Tax=Rhodovibrio salinarum TaxID=1087 RepID=A0A934V1Y0_9PROT|nr:DUF4336 domain-containing protein [Rhodovibrio salinarum]MBK1698846.1 DUF4336 domain-containing protein [Rhodovibrio salinarum]